MPLKQRGDGARREQWCHAYRNPYSAKTTRPLPIGGSGSPSPRARFAGGGGGRAPRKPAACSSVDLLPIAGVQPAGAWSAGGSGEPADGLALYGAM